MTRGTSLGTVAVGAALLVAACGEDATAPRAPEAGAADVDLADGLKSPNDSLVRLVRQLTAGRGITAMPPARHVRPATSPA